MSSTDNHDFLRFQNQTEEEKFHKTENMNEGRETDSAIGGHGDGGGDNTEAHRNHYNENDDHNREELFTDTVLNTLTENGELQKLHASMRATIINVMRGGDHAPIVKVKEKNRNPATDMVNRMIMDYLHWYGCEYSIEMFATEIANVDGTKCPDRRSLAEKMTAAGLITDDDNLPVLMQIAMQVMCEQSKKK